MYSAISHVAAQAHDPERAREVVEWVLDQAIEAADKARGATCLDDWLLGKAHLRPITEVLHALDIEHRHYLTGVQRAMASQFEEVRADLGGDSWTLRVIGSAGRPYTERLLGIGAVGIGYQREYGDQWLDRMLEDRVLAPLALRDVIADAYRGRDLPTVVEIELPPEWRTVSPNLAWPLCMAFSREMLFERSTELPWGEVERACRQLGFTPETKHGTGEFRDEDQAVARHELSAQELSVFLQRSDLFESGNESAALREFERVSLTFPYNYVVQRELGIRNDESGNIQQGFWHLRAAVLLEPTDASNWHSFGVVLRRMGFARDAALAAGVKEMIEKRDAA